MKTLEFIEKTLSDVEALVLDVSRKVWEYAELPYAEYQSAALYCKVLREQGFEVAEGVAEMPTAFTGTFVNGSGGVVMGFLGEYDALDALSQKAAEPTKSPIVEGAPGHGCGHNLLGAGSLASALILKEYLVANDIPGTVIYYGCAAEEGAGAKQFMARAGLFDGVDFAYTWHPARTNEISADKDVAIMGANFEFKGRTAHAGGSPHLGRSALDAAELMSVGCNYLREHILDGQRIHYAYVDVGGTAPNVVQEHALVKYEVRSQKIAEVKELFERVVNVARGAAIMTDTQMSYEVTMAFSDYIPNHELALIAQECLQEVGAPEWTDEEYALAKKFLTSFDENTIGYIKEEVRKEYGEDRYQEILERPLDSEIHPYTPEKSVYVSGSTDVGDVTYAVPCLNVSVATQCIGNVGHTWQNVAQSGSTIGEKGMLTAAKVMALAAVRTMDNPQAIERAKKLVLAQNGGAYQCPVPDSVKPPVGRY
jgi:aminobenzoyl-glutamate utilization protein B